MKLTDLSSLHLLKTTVVRFASVSQSQLFQSLAIQFFHVDAPNLRTLELPGQTSERRTYEHGNNSEYAYDCETMSRALKILPAAKVAISN